MIEGLEQPEALPPASVAVPQKVVVESLATVTSRPGLANCAAVPIAATAEVQVALVYRRTVEPLGAPPITRVVFEADGEAGEVELNVGASGLPSPSTRRTRWLPQSLM